MYFEKRKNNTFTHKGVFMQIKFPVIISFAKHLVNLKQKQGIRAGLAEYF